MPQSNTSPLEQARLEAVFAAQREHARLGTLLTRQVEIFEIIEKENVWLFFQPLERLFGAYLRPDGVPGIIVNANHPSSLQRFTAAHEYGHHVLRHQPTLDDERSIKRGGGPSSLTEVAAHTFAAHFLMPLQLVNAVLKKMGLPQKPGRLSSRQAYLLALELGVSYAAVVTHLAALRKVAPANAAELGRLEPKRIKTEIGRGSRPLDAWADVWPLDEADAGRLIFPRVNDQLLLTLDEAPSTGYIWTLDPSVPGHSGGDTNSGKDINDHISLMGDDYEPPLSRGEEEQFGGTGTRRLTFQVSRPGRIVLRLTNRRPWQVDAAPTRVFEIELRIRPRQTGDSDRGVSERLKPLLAA